jgi:hypothetical protein
MYAGTRVGYVTLPARKLGILRASKSTEYIYYSDN